MHLLRISRVNLLFIIYFFFVAIPFNLFSENQKNQTKVVTKNIETLCLNSLEWYDRHPGYKGEYRRVLEYCKTYAKDVSPEGFLVNPILSDFGVMSGVNTRPRDQIHQGIDIIGSKNEPIIAVADGLVLEATVEDCWGSTLVIDHGESLDGKKLIVLYAHIGKFNVKENDYVKRGDIIARLPEKVQFMCMARVRHLHLQIGQKYCQKEEKDNWGCKYFIKDFYNSLNPHSYWADGPNKVSCFNKEKKYSKGTLTYPFQCKKLTAN